MGACSFSHSIPAAAPRELFFSTPELPLCHRTVTAYILSGRTRSCSCRSAVSSLVTGFLSAGAPLPQRSLSIHRRRESASVQAASSDALSPSMAASSSPDAEQKPFAVLFVCLGNICRSPAAEGVFRSLVSKRGLDSRFKIDSAGTIGYHEGNLADPRMRTSSSRRGIEITSISRPIRPADFNDFDLILAMDKQNREDILSAYERWSFKEQLPKEAQKKVKLMCSYCKKHNESEVPDPYYGGPQGFEKVLDLLEDACESLLDTIVAEKFSHT